MSIDENERMELERIVMDADSEAALEFIRKVIYAKVKESEKPGSCFHDVAKPIDEVPRTVRKHKRLGSFD
jgi:hypothetical protein